MSAAEDLLAFQLKAVGIPFSREVRFAVSIGRQWRADFLIPAKPSTGPCLVCDLGYPSLCRRHGLQTLVEIDGATWTGGRHVTGAGVEADCEKSNAATLLGYRLLRFVPHQVESGAALKTIESALSDFAERHGEVIGE